MRRSLDPVAIVKSDGVQPCNDLHYTYQVYQNNTDNQTQSRCAQLISKIYTLMANLQADLIGLDIF